MPHRVNEEEFGRLVEEALAEMPPQFAEFLADVPIQVRDQPTPGQLASLDMGEDHLLLGLYVGRPLTRRSVLDEVVSPDVIYLFKEDIEQVSRNRADLVRQVRTTVLHEIGHHFGMDEDDLEAAGYG